MIDAGELSSRGAKDTLLELYKNGGSARDIAESNNYIQQNDESAMKELVIKLITDNPDQAQELRDGADKLTAFFVGQAMKESQGTANPGTVAKLLKELL